VTPEQRRLEAHLAQLQQELQELVRSMPAHSMKASMFLRVEDLEDAIAETQDRLAQIEAPDDRA
jgi:hypothetical protein